MRSFTLPWIVALEPLLVKQIGKKIQDATSEKLSTTYSRVFQLQYKKAMHSVSRGA